MKLLMLAVVLTLLGAFATFGDVALTSDDAQPVVASSTSAQPAAEAQLDTSRLPRASGAEEMFASAATTMYLAPESVAKTAMMVEKLLAAAGWQQFTSPQAARNNDPNVSILALKKGPLGLSVFVTVAQAQGDKTSVSYTAVALAHDLPFPPGATSIQFDPNEPNLVCTTREPLDKTLAVLEEKLTALGWQRSTARPEAVQQTERGAWRYFVQPEHDPLFLTLRGAADGRVTVEIKRIPAAALEAEAKSPAAKQPLPADQP